MFSRVLFGFCYADLGTQPKALHMLATLPPNRIPPQRLTCVELLSCKERPLLVLLAAPSLCESGEPLSFRFSAWAHPAFLLLLLLLRMSHVLQFEDKTRKVKDASMQDSDTFEIYDPRNPVNKRRREESKKLLREKKERRWEESGEARAADSLQCMTVFVTAIGPPRTRVWKVLLNLLSSSENRYFVL